MGDTGIEPVTSSVSGKRATAAPIARNRKSGHVHCVQMGSHVGEESGRRDSNSRHPPWQGGALPAELRPHMKHVPVRPAVQQQASCLALVGDTGIEPVTSSVSGKRATAAPIAQMFSGINRKPRFSPRWVRDSNPCIRLCRPLPRLSATPPCCPSHSSPRPTEVEPPSG